MRRHRHPETATGGAKAKAQGRAGRVVLLVDDGDDNRAMYAEFLRDAGYDVLEARDGLEAIETATKLLPDLVIMDLSLPVIDGWEATRRVKGEARTAAIPVIVLSGHSLESDSRTAREAGCDGFLAKPCLPETLLATVENVLAEGPKARRKGRHATRP